MAQITYIPGTSASDKSSYKLGKALLSRRTVTTILSQIDTGKSVDRVVYPALARYPEWLDAMEAAGMTAAEMVRQCREVTPVRTTKGTGVRISRMGSTARRIAAAAAKLYSGGPAEVVQKLYDMLQREGMREEILTVLEGFEKEFGMTGLGRIKTNARMAPQKALLALQSFRQGKGGAKGTKRK